MPKPHYAQVALENTPYDHYLSCYVRRTFLCGFGFDTNLGISFNSLK